MYQKMKGHKEGRVRAEVPDPKVVHMLDHCIWDHRSLVLFKKKQDLQGTIFCGGRILSRKCSKSSFFC